MFLCISNTYWLTQEQIADLFGTKRPAITKHLNNIYKSGELDIDSTCSILEHVGNDDKQRYTTNYAILPIGYWIKGKNATFCLKKANGVSELENHFATFVNAKRIKRKTRS